LADLLREALPFPHGANDDQINALQIALAKMSGRKSLSLNGKNCDGAERAVRPAAEFGEFVETPQPYSFPMGGISGAFKGIL
jgi:hypothetical protein